MEMNLQHITHASIDKSRWNETIETATHGLMYAKSEFLDAMSPGWEAIICPNYEYIMPLTWRKKWGMRYLCQPAFAQQLGIFGNKTVDPILQSEFLKLAAEKFRLIEIFTNHGCHPTDTTTVCNNYVLNLNQPYERIREDYRKDLLKNLNRTQKFDLVYKESKDPGEALQIYRDTYGANMGYRPADWEAFKNLCEDRMPKGQCLIRKVVRPLPGKQETELLAIGLFLKDENRLYNVASTTLPNGRMMEANHFLFDELIREFASQNVILDFEGSDLPGVARFYQKFGPVNQPYYFWKSNRLPGPLKWLKS